MAFDNRTYATIEEYLAGNLAGKALQVFEQQLQNDPALAEEVAIFRDMAAALRPSEEDALLANLDLLGQHFTPTVSVKNHTRRCWLLLIIPLAAIIGWWVWRSVSPALDAEPSEMPPVQLNAPPVAEEIQPATPQQKETAPPMPPSQKEKQPPFQPDKPAPLAAAFQPNPQLENMIGSQLRSNDYQFRITQPAANAILKLENGRAKFLLSGTVVTSVNQVDEPFRVLLFSNRQADYENFHFLFSKHLSFEKSGDAFQFRWEEQLALKPGLYYYLIEEENSGTVFQAGKLKVD